MRVAPKKAGAAAAATHANTETHPVYHPNRRLYLRGASCATQWYCPVQSK